MDNYSMRKGPHILQEASTVEEIRVDGIVAVAAAVLVDSGNDESISLLDDAPTMMMMSGCVTVGFTGLTYSARVGSLATYRTVPITTANRPKSPAKA